MEMTEMEMTEMENRGAVAYVYKVSIPLLIGLSFLTYQYDLALLSKVYLGLAMYFALLTGPELDFSATKSD
jgi:hypothetical protein